MALNPILIALDQAMQAAIRGHDPSGSEAALNLACHILRSDGVTETEIDAVIALTLRVEPDKAGEIWRARERIWHAQSLKPTIDFLISRLERGEAEGRTAFTNLMRVAHAAAAVDGETPRQSELLVEVRKALTSALSGAGVAVGADDPDEPDLARTDSASSADGKAEVADDTPWIVDDARFEAAIEKLDELVGLDVAKQQLHNLADRVYIDQLRRDAGLKIATTSRHLVFVGNPGTGKTTVARIVADIYAALGVVPQGQLVEVGRADLVAGFVGQTAMKTQEVFATAIGGLFFLDEAYALVRSESKDFGTEALDTLVAEMENHRDTTAVIAAGYPREMKDFMAANPGLASRFPRTVEFPDYTTDELIGIADIMTEGSDYELTAAARERLAAWIDSVRGDRDFGNARLARNVLEESYDNQARRLRAAATVEPDQLRVIDAEDLQIELGVLPHK